ncbi:MAG: YceI family protein [Candidatus Sulfotelmatobacter sp.]
MKLTLIDLSRSTAAASVRGALFSVAASVLSALPFANEYYPMGGSDSLDAIWVVGLLTFKEDLVRLTVFCLLASALLPSLAQAQGPVFTITPEESDVKFFVKASVAIDGRFNEWEATLTFPSTDVTSGILDIKISADSVNTGSGMKDNKLKSKDFFNASEDPYITFHSTQIVQTGPTTFDVPGTFTIRGVSKPETLNLSLTGKGTGEGNIKGTMGFDRKDYGMNKGIPFVKIGDRVEVSVALKAHKVSGPPLVYRE